MAYKLVSDYCFEECYYNTPEFLEEVKQKIMSTCYEIWETYYKDEMALQDFAEYTLVNYFDDMNIEDFSQDYIVQFISYSSFIYICLQEISRGIESSDIRIKKWDKEGFLYVLGMGSTGIWGEQLQLVLVVTSSGTSWKYSVKVEPLHNPTKTEMKNDSVLVDFVSRQNTVSEHILQDTIPIEEFTPDYVLDTIWNYLTQD